MPHASVLCCQHLLPCPLMSYYCFWWPGALLGAGPDNFTYCKVRLELPWIRVDNSGNIQSIEVNNDGLMFAVSAQDMMLLPQY
jgi:hypothetical protein